MKRALAVLAVSLSLGLGAVAQADELFKDGEVSLIGFGNWIDQQEDHWGGGLGLDYFFCKYAGIGAVTHLENFSGSFIDNLAGEFYLRLPLSGVSLAPYAVGTGGYSWDYEHWFYGGGGGLEWRFTKEFGIFSDVQYIWNEGTTADGIGVRFGFRIAM